MSGIARRRRDEHEPVVITGLAAVSPLGATSETIFDRLFAGASGVREIEVDPRARTDARFAAPVAEIPVSHGYDLNDPINTSASLMKPESPGKPSAAKNAIAVQTA
jgi:3-oxoacyl-(acyl-carrier-protein) synthase